MISCQSATLTTVIIHFRAGSYM